MLYFEVSAAYTVVNLLLATIIIIKSRQNLANHFYFFLVCILVTIGIMAFIVKQTPPIPVRKLFEFVLIFLYSLFPFFFLHFMVIFVRRYEILRSKLLISGIYMAGLFSYAMVLAGYLPRPIAPSGSITQSGFIFYVTWMSIFFSIGIALLYELTKGFYGKVEKANLLLVGFALLLLILPGPFTDSVFFGIFKVGTDWYLLSCTFAIVIAVYFVFRHKVIVNTIYDALKSALSVMNDIFLTMNEDFQIQMVRGSVEAILGYSEREMLGRSMKDFIAQSDYLDAYREYVTKHKMKESYFDADVMTKQGSRLPMNFSFTPMFVNEELNGFVSIGRDITERKEAEKLQTVLYRIAQAADTAPHLLDLFQEVHSIIREVMAAENFYISLYDEKYDFLSFPYFVSEQQPTPGTRHRGNGLTEYVLRTGKSLLCNPMSSDELRLRRTVELGQSSSGIWLGVPLIAERKTIGVMAVIHYTDPQAYGERERNILEYISSQVAKVIEQKRAEEEIQLLAHTVESISEIVTITNLENKFTFVNNAFLKRYGYTEDEILGKDVSLIQSRNNPPEIAREISVQTRNGGWRGELLNVSKEGEEFPIELSTSQIRDTEGNVVGLVGIAADVSERKKLEEQFRHAQKMESIGTLAGGVAHDFNNILQIILFHSMKFKKPNLAHPDLLQNVENINKAIQRGAGLIRQILTFARKTDVLFEPLNVNQMVEEVGKIIVGTFPKNIEFALQLDNTVGNIVADRTQVHQVMLNLCINARDAMPDGGRLTIRTENTSPSKIKERFADAKDKPYLSISVIDTGTGMDEATRARMFEPFFTTKERGKGTGLGLAVVYGIVESHSGYIDVDSELGRGTTFKLFFPLQPTKAALIDTAELEDVTDIKGGSETILIVEDEEMLLSSLKSLFEEKGYKVYCASDGLQAVEIYQQHSSEIALVLADLGLPKLSGWDAFLKMKQVRKGVKMVLASGFIDPVVKNEKIELGARDIIEKPYKPGVILKRVREIIDEE